MAQFSVRSTLRRVERGVRRRARSVLTDLGVLSPRPVEPPPPFSAPPLDAKVSPMAEAVAARDAAPAGVDDVPGAPLITRTQVEQLFEDMVRPALQSDGGDITLVDVKDNDVYVELVGACQTCPSSIVTMQMGIERLLQEEFPQFGRLIRVDADPAPSPDR
jgi:Fe-S cluster biogenesis protein NfuA